MIRNEREYRITKVQARRFEAALERLTCRESDEGELHPRIARAQRDAVASQLADLRRGLAEYEALRDGRVGVVEVESFADLPKALIQARIAAGLTQRGLAERLRLKEQQIQKYEATDYSSASFTRLRDVVEALGVSVREDVLLPGRLTSPQAVESRLKRMGIEREFVVKRLVPRALRARLEAAPKGEDSVDQSLAHHLAALVERVFGVSVANLMGERVPMLPSAVPGMARYKLPSRVDDRRLHAYVLYAHYIALLVLDATVTLPTRAISTDAEVVRAAMDAPARPITFERALDYVWNLGVPVVPLSDPGPLHGACWRVAGRNVIVLKQSTRLEARWLHDLLHELWHAGQDPGEGDMGVVELEGDPGGGHHTAEETAASRFAGDVMLEGRAEELAKLCVREAGGRLERLKSVVPAVATAQSVSVGGLANYVAFRLSLQGENWWGAATNLQCGEPDPWQVARDVLLRRVDLVRLNEVDRVLLMQAAAD